MAQLCATAGHDHALVHDVRSQFGRGLLQHAANRADDCIERFADRLGDFVAANLDSAGQARYLIAASHLHSQFLLQWQGRADLHLDVLGGAFADHQVVLALDVGGNRLVQLVAAHTNAVADYDAVERDDRYLSGAAADVNDQVAAAIGDRQLRPQCGGQRLTDEVNLAGVGLQRGIAYRAALHTGHARGDANHHFGLG